MNVSQRELRALAQAAALGLGFSYGTVEELARAVVWLSARGLDGLGALLEAGPSSNSNLHVGSAGPGLLDLVVGEVLAGGRPVERDVSGMDSPLLLVGLCGIRSAEHRVAFELQAAGTADRAGDHTADHTVGRVDGSALALDDTVELRSIAPLHLQASASTGAVLDGARNPVERPIISTERWKAAQALAKTTYVPSNEHSRTQGAGAGLTDND